MTHSQKLASHSLREEYSDLARGWAMVQAFKELWDFTSETWALKHFKRWYFWATHSRLKPFIKLAKTLKSHLENILTYLRIPITNAAAEGLNSKIHGQVHGRSTRPQPPDSRCRLPQRGLLFRTDIARLSQASRMGERRLYDDSSKHRHESK